MSGGTSARKDGHKTNFLHACLILPLQKSREHFQKLPLAQIFSIDILTVKYLRLFFSSPHALFLHKQSPTP